MQSLLLQTQSPREDKARSESLLRGGNHGGRGGRFNGQADGGRPGKFVIATQRPSVRSYWKILYLARVIAPVQAEGSEMVPLIRRTVLEEQTPTATFTADALALADVVLVSVQCDYMKEARGDMRQGYADIAALGRNGGDLPLHDPCLGHWSDLENQEAYPPTGQSWGRVFPTEEGLGRFRTEEELAVALRCVAAVVLAVRHAPYLAPWSRTRSWGRLAAPSPSWIALASLPTRRSVASLSLSARSAASAAGMSHASRTRCSAPQARSALSLWPFHCHDERSDSYYPPAIPPLKGGRTCTKGTLHFTSNSCPFTSGSVEVISLICLQARLSSALVVSRAGTELFLSQVRTRFGYNDDTIGVRRGQFR